VKPVKEPKAVKQILAKLLKPKGVNKQVAKRTEVKTTNNNTAPLKVSKVFGTLKPTAKKAKNAVAGKGITNPIK